MKSTLKKISIAKIIFCPLIPVFAIALYVFLKFLKENSGFGVLGFVISLLGAMIYNYIPLLLAGLVFYVLLFKFTDNRLAFTISGALVAVLGSLLLINNNDPFQLFLIVVVGAITGFFYSPISKDRKYNSLTNS